MHSKLTKYISLILAIVMIAALIPGYQPAAKAEAEGFAGKTVSILSHSASTYAGVSNNTADNSTIGNNDVYYTAGQHGVYLKDTWWQQAIDALGMRLLVNNSWSGSCVFQPRKGAASVGYKDRAVNLHNDHTGEEPDIIWVYIGCNDFAYYKDTFGKAADVDYSALIKDNGDGTFTYAAPANTCEAYAITLHKAQSRYPDAQIYCMTSTARRETDYTGDSYPDAGQPTEYSAQLQAIAEHFGYPVIDLEKAIPKDTEIFDKYMGDKRAHPNALGMDQITNELLSVMLGRDAEICHVTSEQGVVAEQAVLKGGSYSAEVELPDGYSVTVTMAGKDITAEAWQNGSIAIAEVTGDITVTNHRPPMQFAWKASGSELISTGENENPLKKLEGTITDGVFNNGRYELTTPVILRNDLPWVVEWKCAGDWRAAVLSSDSGTTKEGTVYLTRTKGGQLCLGTRAGSQYDNYGIDLSDLDAQSHTYRLENRIAADGGNMVWLYLDDVELGPMNNYFIGSKSQNTTSDWVSGKKFVFSHIGTDSNKLSNCELEYLRVTECDHTYKNGICTTCGAAHPNMASFEGKVISVLSASTSTFAGYIPVADGFNLAHRARYPQDNLLTDVDETWWMQLVNALDAKLGINDSWAGSQVLNTQDTNSGDLGPDAAMASLTRIKNLGANGTPDVILFFGAGNDIGRGVDLGSFDPASAPTTVDLTSTKWDSLADAYVAAIMRLQHFYPDSEIVAMTTYAMPGYATEAKLNRYGAVIEAICEHYGVPYLNLRDSGVTFDMLPDNIHPNAEGMDHITEAVLNKLLNDVELESGENTVYSVTHELSSVKASLGYYKGISAGKAFAETLSGDDMTVTVTMGGKDITASCYADGKVNISAVSGDVKITAKARFNADGHLQQLPETVCAGTNLWTALEPENIYYTVNGWGLFANSPDVHSVTFPVEAGERIWATSFGKTSSGIGTRITWFTENGLLETVPRDKVYDEFTENGYITVPDGAASVNIPMGDASPDREIYLLDRAHTYTDGICEACGKKEPAAALTSYKGKVISVMGDSISTYAGYIPVADGFNLAHRTRYPDTSRIPDVIDVNQTWWMQLVNELDAKLGINESWAGSCIYWGDNMTTKNSDTGEKAAMASLTRIQNLGSNGTPDLIFLYGGGNDRAKGVTVGNFDAANVPDEADLTAVKWDTFADSCVAAIMRMQHYYPDAEIVVLMSRAGGENDYIRVMREICEYFEVTFLFLNEYGLTSDMHPDGSHPNAEGMDVITDAILAVLADECTMTPGENTVYSVSHELSSVKASLGYYKGISAGKPFAETLSGDDLTVTVTMGGKDITASCYADGKVNIPTVTGDVKITAKAKFNADGHLQQLPETVCAGTNLWTALEPENIYYTVNGWGNTTAGTTWSITFPVKAGDRIWATSLGAYPGNGSTANGVRITWFDENGVLETVSRDVVYKEFAANGYVTAPEGAVALNLPMTGNKPDYAAYILNLEHTYTAAVTPPTCTEQGYTTYTCACGDSYVDDYVDATEHDYENGICTGCGEQNDYSGHLQQLPEQLCGGTNLWPLLRHDADYYYAGTHWGQLDDVHSVTIPVMPGDQLAATSFSRGIRVTYFDGDGMMTSVADTQVKQEFEQNGYLTVPDGAAAVNIPMWDNSNANELYIRNRPHSYADDSCSLCGYERRRVGAEELNRVVGGVYVKDGTYNTAFTNNWFADIPIPKGAEQVRVLTFKTAAGCGSVFFGAGKHLSGYADTTVGGQWVTLNIPTGADTFRYCYVYDSVAQEVGLPLFEYVEFYGRELGEVEPPPFAYRPATGCHSFSVEVNIAPAQGDPNGYAKGTDYGYIQLPANYDPYGEPTRLIIVCHGAGANLSTYQSDAWKTTNYSFWTDLGYAVMDMYASPTELAGDTGGMHYGSPIVVDCYKAGYDYVMDRFNLKQDGIFLIGSSMGGLSSFQIAQSGEFPVIAQVGYCPAIDTFKQAYVNPWSTASYQRSRIAKYFGFTGTAPTFTNTKFPSAAEIEYYKNNFDKTIPYSPIFSKVVSGDLEKIFDVIPSSATAVSTEEEALYQQLTATHPNPLMIFHNTDDGTVAYRYSKYFVDMVNRSGQNAILRTFTSGGHNAWANGADYTVPGLNGNITIKESQYEAYMFFKKYEEHETHIGWVDPATAPACTETGLTQGSHCAVCGEVLLEQEVVAATGHTPGEAVKENEAADGAYDSVVYCTACGAELSREHVEGKTHTPGDINGDGSVNNKDFTRLFQYLADWDVEVVEAALDVNGDGTVNNKDLTRLFQYLSDWDVEIH